MEEQQEHWTRQTARSLRFLADKLEESEELEMGCSYGSVDEPRVLIKVADYAGVDQMAELMGAKAEIGGYGNSYYQVSLDADSTCIRIQTPAVTIPRACEYCDQKHDCTHVEGDVA